MLQLVVCNRQNWDQCTRLRLSFKGVASIWPKNMFHQTDNCYFHSSNLIQDSVKGFFFPLYFQYLHIVLNARSKAHGSETVYCSAKGETSGDHWFLFFVIPDGQETRERREDPGSPQTPCAVTWRWQAAQHLPISGSQHRSVAGPPCTCTLEDRVAAPGYPHSCDKSSLFLQHAVPKGVRGANTPYFVLLAIYCKELLKHFEGTIQKQSWKMSDLSIESWVQYVTVGNPPSHCKLWNPQCMGILDVFHERKYGPN